METEQAAADNLADVRSCEVVLGDQRYTVEEASYLRARRFWPLLSEQLSPIGDALKAAKGLGPGSEVSDFATLLPVIQQVLLEAPGAILDAICAYDAGLERQRADIEATATDRQIVAALMALIEMSDPFGVKRLVRRGLSIMAPGSSSPAASGE